ncbi:hypothetical protein T440DRAFT_208321 [Plenodomus tracheiphilus IPT5]|uniref:Uncharacterized protein n=1 Tax=Plenodomus tracheiphilus IPT5 TaxID=1408161 RepID=A0A6A7BLC8_9PLEO|nr:hypothetical protein T440DRAFT_208321 [Plenodomus tracheiphilus IPT5]
MKILEACDTNDLGVPQECELARQGSIRDCSSANSRRTSRDARYNAFGTASAPVITPSFGDGKCPILVQNQTLFSGSLCGVQHHPIAFLHVEIRDDRGMRKDDVQTFQVATVHKYPVDKYVLSKLPMARVGGTVGPITLLSPSGEVGALRENG